MNSEVVNLENCAREPIHIPGSIQPHGLLFVLREPELTVLQVSENVESLLGIAPEQVLNRGLSTFLESDRVDRVRKALEPLDPTESNPVELRLRSRMWDGALDGFVHRHGGFSFLEMEAATLGANARFLEFYKLISRLTARLHAAGPLNTLLKDAAGGMRELTEFDRVMVYRFAPNFEGEVVAEARRPELEPYLGLWYPASDIPSQARELYRLNLVRNVVDVADKPAMIVPGINPQTHKPVDLSFAGLRSVSPIHCEYLRNMGVAASMSVSIVCEGRLWGLIAFHHQSPKFVPFEMRKACAFLGQVLAGEVQRRVVEEDATYRFKAIGVQAKFLEQMASSAQPLLGLIQGSPNLLDLVPASGAALVLGDKVHTLGDTPGYTDVLSMVQELQMSGAPPAFITSSLKNHMPLTVSLQANAAGVIALELRRSPAHYILFFRPEVEQTVTWGGNPEKPVLPSESGLRVSPRKSFAAWKETVKGRAVAWADNEVRAATELRDLVSAALYSKGERAAQQEG